MMKTLLRFLITGDLQAHAWRQFSYIRDDGMNSRLYNILSVFDEMENYAMEHGINKIFFNGDIFEESDYHQTEVFNAIYIKFAEMYGVGMKLGINLGNHEIVRRIEGEVVPVHTLVPFFRVAKIIEWPSIFWDHLFIIPYMSAEGVKAAIQKHLRVNEQSVLIFHGGVQGARAGPKQYLVRNQLKLEDLRPKKWKLILLSDYHTSQYLRDNVLYLGSPIQHSFGETHTPGFWDVTLYDEEPWYELKRIKTNLPRFIQMEISSIKELEDAKEKLRGNYVHLKLLSTDIRDEIDSFAKTNGITVKISIEREDRRSDSKRSILGTTLPVQHILRYARRLGKGKSFTRLGCDLYEGKNE
jgi:hypothetical protein